MLFSSALEVPAYTVFAPIVMLFGRRRVLAANFAVCAAAILAILIVPGSETCRSFLFFLFFLFFGKRRDLRRTQRHFLLTAIRSFSLDLH